MIYYSTYGFPVKYHYSLKKFFVSVHQRASWIASIFFPLRRNTCLSLKMSVGSSSLAGEKKTSVYPWNKLCYVRLFQFKISLCGLICILTWVLTKNKLLYSLSSVLPFSLFFFFFLGAEWHCFWALQVPGRPRSCWLWLENLIRISRLNKWI